VTEPRPLFDAVADDYDRFRPGYPASLVDEACSIAGLRPGSRVLEVGCGTGQLTVALAERGLRMDAIDPGPRIIEIAPRFTGSIRTSAGRRRRGCCGRGACSLLSIIAELTDDVLAAWREVFPEAAAWESHDPEAVREGARARRGNVSEFWAWLGKREIARPEAAELFADLRVNTVPVERVQTAAEMIGEARTTSAYLRLDGERRARLERRLGAIVAAAGGTYKSTTFATLSTARAT